MFQRLTVPEVDDSDYLLKQRTESTLVSELGKEDYSIINQLLSYLGYEDVYHYLFIEKKELAKSLAVPTNYRDSTFIINRNRFLKGRRVGNPFFAPFTKSIQEYFWNNYYKKLDSLTFLQLNKEFDEYNYEYYDFKKKIKSRISLYEYMNSNGEDVPFVHYLESLQTTREVFEAIILKPDLNSAQFNVKLESNKFKSLCFELAQNLLIDDPRIMYFIFLGNDQENKILWLHNDLRLLVFFIRILELYMIIGENNRTSSINIEQSFVDPDGKPYTAKSISDARYGLKLSGLSKKGILSFVTEIKNPTYKILNKIVLQHASSESR